jgi:alkylation response protein AidB-like acyl-CoA dehydrogenase
MVHRLVEQVADPEPITTSLIGERPLKTRARRIDGGYSVSGRKMFASMLEAADRRNV